MLSISFPQDDAKRLNVHVVKYEDLVEDPERILKNIFTFFGVDQVDDFVQVAMMKHRQRIEKADVVDNGTEQDFSSKEKTLAYLNEYYGTSRKTKFSPSHWKDELTLQQLNEIHENGECIKAFNFLSYPINGDYNLT